MSDFQRATVRVGYAGLNGTGVSGAEKTDIFTRLTDLEALTPPTVLDDLDDCRTTGPYAPDDGDLWRYNGPAEQWEPYTPEAITVAAVMPYVIDGGGVAITTGLRYGFRVNNAGTITGWHLGADINTTSSVQVWKDTTANFPPVVGDIILTMSTTAGTKYGSATGLSIAFSSGDWFYFNVSANNSATVLLPNINFTREVGP